MTPDPVEGGISAQVVWQEVEQHLGLGRPVIFPLQRPGKHRVDYVVTDQADICLRLQLDPRDHLPHSSLPVIRVQETSVEGMRMARLTCTEPHLLRDFHDFLNSVATRVVAQGLTPRRALQDTISAWSAILERPRVLDTRQRIGLLGELAVLDALAEHLGWNTVVAGWKGPDDEEHDFGLPNFDVEVKTTAGERRRHVVQGAEQLTPGPGRDLWVVSHRLTRGGARGRTLTECLENIRDRITEDAPSAVDLFDQQVHEAGWRPDRRDDERWSFRDTSLVLPCGQVPALGPSVLDHLPEELRHRIDQVTYRVDLTGIEPQPGIVPPELRTFRLP
ncbi:PD-(D/E)XK motif protein [Streptomyces diacarni]|uniref:PD-(D/E)XK motif protein n=1 Tax=Streptomyces diacarni TaxID=2800381 RepID=A0A367F1P0_9ACTN|nr:PD-(D/E)XK motif protein [Streptomyces diacarni]RCG23577.1 PD-(D/E)XK motif protein [Streptomyces diacarni]